MLHAVTASQSWARRLPCRPASVARSATLFLIITNTNLANYKITHFSYIHTQHECSLAATKVNTPELWRGAAGLCARTREYAGAAELLTYTHTHYSMVPPPQPPTSRIPPLLDRRVAMQVWQVWGVERLGLDGALGDGHDLERWKLLQRKEERGGKFST